MIFQIYSRARKYPTIEESLRKIKELGFNTFDLDALEGWQHIDPSKIASGNDAWVNHLLEIIDDLKLKISSVNCSLSRKLTDQDHRAFTVCKDEFTAMLEFAEKVSSPNLTLQPGPIFGSQVGSLATLRVCLTELSRLKEGYDVSVSLEGHANTVFEEPETALSTVREFWPNIGYTYDPSHFVMNSVDITRTEELLNYTYHVHVRNASPGNMQDTMANGTMDFRWLICALRTHGYKGALTIEYFRDFDPSFESTTALRNQLITLGMDAS